MSMLFYTRTRTCAH